MKHTSLFRCTRWIPAVTLLLILSSGAGRAQSLGDQARELRKANPSRPAQEPITEDDLPRQDEMLSSETCHLPEHVVETTACEVNRNPERFDGKLVSIRGRVHADDDGMDLREDGCGGVLVVHSEDVGRRDPQGYRTCHGPRFRKMHQLVTTAVHVDQIRGRPCPRCTIHPEVMATLIGRVQANPHADSRSGSRERTGFGFSNEYRARVVLFSVQAFNEIK